MDEQKQKKIIDALNLIEGAKVSIQEAVDILSGMVGKEEMKTLLSKAKNQGNMLDFQEEKVIEGVFDGENMIGPDGKQYAVPANYASKSKLVEGDLLKLTIDKYGNFTYKQIGPIEKIRLKGTLVKDEATGNWKVLAEGRAYNILLAPVTYFKGEAGDEAVILVPKDKGSKWAAVEHIIKQANSDSQDYSTVGLLGSNHEQNSGSLFASEENDSDQQDKTELKQSETGTEEQKPSFEVDNSEEQTEENILSDDKGLGMSVNEEEMAGLQDEGEDLDEKTEESSSNDLSDSQETSGYMEEPAPDNLHSSDNSETVIDNSVSDSLNYNPNTEAVSQIEDDRGDVDSRHALDGLSQEDNSDYVPLGEEADKGQDFDLPDETQSSQNFEDASSPHHRDLSDVSPEDDFRLQNTDAVDQGVSNLGKEETSDDNDFFASFDEKQVEPDIQQASPQDDIQGGGLDSLIGNSGDSDDKKDDFERI